MGIHKNEPDAEPAKSLTSKEAATSQPPPVKRRKQLPQGPDKCKLQLAGAAIPTTMIHLHQTGVPKGLSLREQVQKVSQSTNVHTRAVLIQQHNLLSAVPTSIGNTWVYASNVNYVIAAVLGLWTYRSILKMST